MRRAEQLRATGGGCGVLDGLSSPAGQLFIGALLLAAIALLTLIAVLLVPVFANATRIINLLQMRNRLGSIPTLWAVIRALLFRGVDSRAAVAGAGWGVLT